MKQTISCLLIHPNPDSALNSAAGALLQEDYDAFARHARLMTSIHASIPRDMKDAVMEARRRGDENGMVIHEEEDQFPISSRKPSTISSLIMKKKPSNGKGEGTKAVEIRIKHKPEVEVSADSQQKNDAESDGDDTGSASKENDPCLSPSPVAPPLTNSWKSVLGKRPLSVLAAPVGPDMILTDADEEFDGMTSSEKNIAANCSKEPSQLQRKSPKFSELRKRVNTPGRLRDDNSDSHRRCQVPEQKDLICAQGSDSQVGDDSVRRLASSIVFPDYNGNTGDGSAGPALALRTSDEDILPGLKQMHSFAENSSILNSVSSFPSQTHCVSAVRPPKLLTATRKVGAVSTSVKSKPRIGVRRL
jgi:hypothetical protein